MANDVMIFNVDASDIMVKLHFAGLQATRGDVSKTGGFIVNTGIENDNPNGSPESIGKTRFLLDNKSKTYYVGVVSDVVFTKSFTLDNALNDIAKLKAELDGSGKKLLSRSSAEDADMVKRFDEYIKRIKDAYAKDGGKDTLADDDFLDVDKLQKIKDSLVELKKENEIESDYQNKIDERRKDVISILSNYMTVFAGAENTSNITEDDIAEMQVSSKFIDPNSSGLVKDFAFQPISTAEKSQLMNSFNANSAKSEDGQVECKINMCFYVLYKLDVK